VPLKFAAAIELTLAPRLPAGAQMCTDALQFIRVMGGDGSVLVQETHLGGELPVRVMVPADKGSDRSPWQVDLGGAYRTNDSLDACLPLNVRWIVPVN